MRRLLLGYCSVLLGVCFAPAVWAQNDLLPDLIINEDRLLSDARFVTDIVPGRLHLRLSNATPNIGTGELRVRAAESSGNTQVIEQIISQDDGGSYAVEAGVFIFHASHDHFHVDDWAQFRIREVLPDDGVGDLLYVGVKTSFCLLDSLKYGDIPGTPATRVFDSCDDDEQGISVGWEDLYDWTLPDQWIDVTGITPGEYWLESEVDPEDHFLEVDDTNNVARVKLVIEANALPEPDEIPLHPALPWVVTIVLFWCGLGALRGGLRRRGRWAE